MGSEHRQGPGALGCVQLLAFILLPAMPSWDDDESGSGKLSCAHSRALAGEEGRWKHLLLLPWRRQERGDDVSFLWCLVGPCHLQQRLPGDGGEAGTAHSQCVREEQGEAEVTCRGTQDPFASASFCRGVSPGKGHCEGLTASFAALFKASVSFTSDGGLGAAGAGRQTLAWLPSSQGGTCSGSGSFRWPLRPQLLRRSNASHGVGPSQRHVPVLRGEETVPALEHTVWDSLSPGGTTCTPAAHGW